MNSFEEKAAKLRETDSYKIEKLKLELTEQICEKLQEANMDRKDLAKELGTSPAYITKLLSGETNFTVETLYKVGKILKLKLDIKFIPSISGSITLTAPKHSDIAVDTSGRIVNQITGTTSKGNVFWGGLDTTEVSSKLMANGSKMIIYKEKMEFSFSEAGDSLLSSLLQSSNSGWFEEQYNM